MSDNINNMLEDCYVIALVKQQEKIHAVVLRRDTNSYEIICTKNSNVEPADIQEFIADLESELNITSDKENVRKKIIAGFDSSQVIFHQINVPVSKADDISKIVKFQAEARLPLPIEQTELTWRANQPKDGQIPVTLAAAKKQLLQEFVESVRQIQPEKIFLTSEAIVKAWQAFFSRKTMQGQVIIVDITDRSTQLCLVEDGALINTVSLDIGMEDFLYKQQEVQHGFITDRFTQDVISVLETFGCSADTDIPVFVLSDGSKHIETVTSALASAGLKAKSCLPQLDNLTSITHFGVSDVYEYRNALGLGVMAFEKEQNGLDIFQNLYRLAEKGEKPRWYHSLKITGAISVLMLILLIIVFYAADAKSLAGIEKILSGNTTETDFSSILEKQKLTKMIASQRPDMLELLNLVNSCNVKGILLDSFTYRKGQPVEISGSAPNAEILYKFQEALITKKGINDVKILSTSENKNDKKIDFTITFHHKTFTQKQK